MVTIALLFRYCARQQVLGVVRYDVDGNSDENLFTPLGGTGGDYSSAFGFSSHGDRRRHGHRDGWSQLWFLLLAFRSDHQSRRHSAVDLEFEWPQQHLRHPRLTQRALGVRNS